MALRPISQCVVQNWQLWLPIDRSSVNSSLQVPLRVITAFKDLLRMKTGQVHLPWGDFSLHCWS